MRFTMTEVFRGHFDTPLLTELHALADELMAEPYEHFVAHAMTNDLLHVFRDDERDRIVGFQFWRSVPIDGARVVLGGKLRIRPEARRCGLHLAAGLSVLKRQQELYGLPVIRLGVASLFGFVSIVRRVAHYEIIDERCRRPALIEVVDRLTRESHFSFDRKTGLVEVGIAITDAQLAPYPQRYFESPEARAYLAVNPDFRTNRSYVAFAFDFDAQNRVALERGARDAARRRSAAT